MANDERARDRRATAEPQTAEFSDAEEARSFRRFGSSLTLLLLLLALIAYNLNLAMPVFVFVAMAALALVGTLSGSRSLAALHRRWRSARGR